MQALIKKYKPVLRFLAFFFGSYLVLSFLYGQYLDLAASETYYPEIITHQVTQQAAVVVESLGFDAAFSPHPSEASMRFAVDGKYVARIVEGCNAVSVMILFSAFVLAFWQGAKSTLLYIVVGSAMIYVVNIFRVALFVISLKELPQYRDFLHDIAFPGVIYGMMFLLWLFWIRVISTQKNDG